MLKETGDVPASLLDEICILIQHGATIPAIQRYREDTGVTLAKAKHAVDDFIESGIFSPNNSTSRRAIQSLETDVLAVLSRDGKLAAVTLDCERTRVTLKEAKEAVEEIAARHGLPSKRDF